jgi:hypothetical protein
MIVKSSPQIFVNSLILLLIIYGKALAIILISGSKSLATPSNTIIFYSKTAICPSNFKWFY